MNYGISGFGKHTIVKLKINAEGHNVESLKQMFPTLSILTVPGRTITRETSNGGTLVTFRKDCIILQGCVPNPINFPAKWKLYMLSFKIKTLNEQYNSLSGFNL